MTRIRNTQEVKSSSKALKTMTEASLDLDNRICYKKRKEELNKRVKSVLEKKQQIASARN